MVDPYGLEDEPETPRPPRPAPTPGAPTPLPRIKYVPPTPPEGEGEGEQHEPELDETGQPRPRKPRPRGATPEASNPPRAGASVAPGTEPRPRANRAAPPPGREKERARPRDDDRAAERPRKPGRPRDDDRPRGALVEETPVLDTYETRQKVRTAISIGLGLAILVSAFIVYRIAFPPDSIRSEDLPDEGKLVMQQPPDGGGSSKNDAARAEREARQMFSQARLLARSGNIDGALALLQKIRTSYPNASVAREAAEALDRPSQNLPLFVDGPAVSAREEMAASITEDDQPPPAVLDAFPASPTAPATGQGGTDAQIALPGTPAEPRRAGRSASALPALAGQEANPLPQGFRARPEAGVHESGWPIEIVGDRDGATLVLVPGGSYTTGRDDGQPHEGPAHEVNLTTYYIDQHEVTVRQYNLFLQQTGRKPSAGEVDGMPKVRISQAEAIAYAKWAGKSLPTEAQWEAAARSADGRPYPWGVDPSPWGKSRAYKQIDPVMAFRADVSPFGAFDLAANAWEWTADFYDPNYYQQFRSGPASNPTGPPTSHARPPQVVIKGGSKSYHCAWREGMRADVRMPFIGFRCALIVEDANGPIAQGEAAPLTDNPAPAPPPVAAPATTPPPQPAPAPRPAHRPRRGVPKAPAGVTPF